MTQNVIQVTNKGRHAVRHVVHSALNHFAHKVTDLSYRLAHHGLFQLLIAAVHLAT